jgi:hypothetical protein
MKSLVCAVLASLLLGCQAPGDGPAASAATAPSAAWDAFRDAFIEAYFELNPSFAVDQGRHEFDGRIGDWSDESFARRIAFLTNASDDAEAFDAAQLSIGQRFERDYLAHVAREELFWLADADQPHTNLTWYFDNGLDPNVYIDIPGPYETGMPSVYYIAPPDPS